MAHEIEAAATDGVASLTRRRAQVSLPVGAACPNCHATLAGPWCHACGQSAEDFHRSIWRLAAEVFQSLVDVDGRLWRTIPSLIFNPARLTRDYLDGHRTPQAPPFRTFLIVIVAVFLAASLPGAQGRTNVISANPTIAPTAHADINGRENKALEAWLVGALRAVSQRPEAFQAAMNEWAPRFALLALPLSAAMLGLLFVFRRGVFLFDHLIFSMHSLSFQGLLMAVIMLGERLSPLFTLLILAAPAHLFFHLKGVYGLGVIGTLVRMLLLFFGSIVAAAALLLGLLAVGLYEVGA